MCWCNTRNMNYEYVGDYFIIILTACFSLDFLKNTEREIVPWQGTTQRYDLIVEKTTYL